MATVLSGLQLAVISFFLLTQNFIKNSGQWLEKSFSYASSWSFAVGLKSVVANFVTQCSAFAQPHFLLDQSQLYIKIYQNMMHQNKKIYFNNQLIKTLINQNTQKLYTNI